jgi:hypothetical protein
MEMCNNVFLLGDEFNLGYKIFLLYRMEIKR